MTKEEKELLLIDLCGRIPHGFIVHRYSDNCDISINSVDDFAHFLEYSEGEEFKPYLRPMSSMTFEESKHKLSKFFKVINTKIEGVGYIPTLNSIGAIKYIDWLIENHFDYRGLIPMGLALEAKEGMYKI